MDIGRLTPAPWVTGKNLHPLSENFMQPAVAMIGSSKAIAVFPLGDSDDVECDDAEFTALARNAFDVMMRRGWYAIPVCDCWEAVAGAKERHWLWIGGAGARPIAKDPFTALVEADKWYKEHVEGQR